MAHAHFDEHDFSFVSIGAIARDHLNFRRVPTNMPSPPPPQPPHSMHAAHSSTLSLPRRLSRRYLRAPKRTPRRPVVPVQHEDATAALTVTRAIRAAAARHCIARPLRELAHIVDFARNDGRPSALALAARHVLAIEPACEVVLWAQVTAASKLHVLKLSCSPLDNAKEVIERAKSLLDTHIENESKLARMERLLWETSQELDNETENWDVRETVLWLLEETRRRRALLGRERMRRAAAKVLARRNGANGSFTIPRKDDRSAGGAWAPLRKQCAENEHFDFDCDPSVVGGSFRRNSVARDGPDICATRSTPEVNGVGVGRFFTRRSSTHTNRTKPSLRETHDTFGPIPPTPECTRESTTMPRDYEPEAALNDFVRRPSTQSHRAKNSVHETQHAFRPMPQEENPRERTARAESTSNGYARRPSVQIRRAKNSKPESQDMFGAMPPPEYPRKRSSAPKYVEQEPTLNGFVRRPSAQFRRSRNSRRVLHDPFEAMPPPEYANERSSAPNYPEPEPRSNEFSRRPSTEQNRPWNPMQEDAFGDAYGFMSSEYSGERSTSRRQPDLESFAHDFFFATEHVEEISIRSDTTTSHGASSSSRSGFVIRSNGTHSSSSNMTPSRRSDADIVYSSPVSLDNSPFPRREMEHAGCTPIILAHHVDPDPYAMSNLVRAWRATAVRLDVARTRRVHQAWIGWVDLGLSSRTQLSELLKQQRRIVLLSRAWRRKVVGREMMQQNDIRRVVNVALFLEEADAIQDALVAVDGMPNSIISLKREYRERLTQLQTTKRAADAVKELREKERAQEEERKQREAVASKAQDWLVWWTEYGRLRGDLRMLLATLHRVLPKGSNWRMVTHTVEADASQVRSLYRRALLQVHPDRLSSKKLTPLEQVLAQLVFVELQDAYRVFAAQEL